MTSEELKRVTGIVMVALCAWREAGGESHEGKRGVVSVIANRTSRPKWWGRNWVAVVTKPWQFSAMTAKGDPNLIRWPGSDDAAWLECLELAEMAINGELIDNTDGSVYYHDITIQRPKAWGDNIKFACKIGRISFYKEEA